MREGKHGQEGSRILDFTNGSARPTARDWGWLLVLGVLCTAVAHTFLIESLAVLRTQVASVISGLEPIYGLALAALLLGEIPALHTLVGGGLILGTTMVASWQGSQETG